MGGQAGRRGTWQGRGSLVRCLGPGEEHTFWSPDPTRRRVCADCARLLLDEREARHRVSRARE